MILITALLALINGGSFASLLAGFSIADWLALADLLVKLEPTVAAMFRALDNPVIQSMFAAIDADLHRDLVALAGRNAAPTIDGYDANGAVVAINNPDYKG